MYQSVDDKVGHMFSHRLFGLRIFPSRIAVRARDFAPSSGVGRAGRGGGPRPGGAGSPRVPALGFCQGTPRGGEVEAVSPQELQPTPDAVAAALAAQFGNGPIEVPMQALLIAAEN